MIFGRKKYEKLGQNFGSYHKKVTEFPLQYDSPNIKIRDFNNCVETGYLLLDSIHRITSYSSILVVCANDTDTAQGLF